MHFLNMENALPSQRGGGFPWGLRVLVVDDDPIWLKILERMLKKCSYSVTACGLAMDALKLLRERKDGYDIVISDVNMPDMDGFKLLEHVGLEMDLPVIMMSIDGETSRVMKGVQHGACDYLLKPIRMKELRNIWQHVVRKRTHEVREAEYMEVVEGLHMTNSPKKRKASDSDSTKRARVVWTVDLHQKFVRAVDQIGYDKVGPKKILDLMNIPWLTRENVASHLQKYRLYLSRLQGKSAENGNQLFHVARRENSHTVADPTSTVVDRSITYSSPSSFASSDINFSTLYWENTVEQEHYLSANDMITAASKDSIVDYISMKSSYDSRAYSCHFRSDVIWQHETEGEYQTLVLADQPFSGTSEVRKIDSGILGQVKKHLLEESDDIDIHDPPDYCINNQGLFIV